MQAQLNQLQPVLEEKAQACCPCLQHPVMYMSQDMSEHPPVKHPGCRVLAYDMCLACSMSRDRQLICCFAMKLSVGHLTALSHQTLQSVLPSPPHSCDFVDLVQNQVW